MDIEITCNTDDEVIFENIRTNSLLNIPWVTQQESHDGHAVIVGGGPSIKDPEILEQIRWRASLGQTVFALNGACDYLFENDVLVNAQIILDARPENAYLLGDIPSYFIASQCDLEVFHELDTRNKSENTYLWHPKIEGIESLLPQDDPEKLKNLTLIGGGVTVGLSAMCLVYALGYRKIHLFGYDSSHRDDKSHAYSQPMNDKEPICKVKVHGKTFKASLAMAKQAESFHTVCDNLIDLGCIVTIDGDGLLPFMVRENIKYACGHVMSEQEKYKAMWELPEYRRYSPGEQMANKFVLLSGIQGSDTVIDFGCGTGRGAKRIYELTKCYITLVDFSSNCLDEEVKEFGFEFIQSDLTEGINLKNSDNSLRKPYGFCTDVLEHIAPQHIETVIKNIMNCAQKVFFQISLVDDEMGALIGETLHLTVKPFKWWVDTFKYLGYEIIMSEDNNNSAVFYVENLTA